MKLTEKLAEKRAREEKMSVNDFLFERELKLVNRQTVLMSKNVNYMKVALLGYDRLRTPASQDRTDKL